MLHTLLSVLQEHGSAESTGFSSPFEVNTGLFVWTWLIFIILFFLLKKYAWPPIVRLTEEREQTIRRQLDEAEQLNADAKATLEEHKKLLAQSKSEAHQLITEAKTLAEKERERLLTKARDEHGEMLQRAKQEIDAERDKALVELRREAIDLSLAAASKLIRQRLESEGDRKIVEEYLSTLEEQR
ncbi:MAG: hypothetical protein AMS18_06755 [Gemmatimonas sp. SG8_17]|nr:MAG: hypothetical protein AMS18_06755 [Gemmatimonas sp. SG8_17]